MNKAEWDALEDEKECECCGYETKCKEYSTHIGEPHMFCEVCSHTHLSSAVNYPQFCSDEKLYRSVGYIANMLLDEVKKRD